MTLSITGFLQNREDYFFLEVSVYPGDTNDALTFPEDFE